MTEMFPLYHITKRAGAVAFQQPYVNFPKDWTAFLEVMGFCSCVTLEALTLCILTSLGDIPETLGSRAIAPATYGQFAGTSHGTNLL